MSKIATVEQAMLWLKKAIGYNILSLLRRYGSFETLIIPDARTTTTERQQEYFIIPIDKFKRVERCLKNGF